MLNYIKWFPIRWQIFLNDNQIHQDFRLFICCYCCSSYQSIAVNVRKVIIPTLPFEKKLQPQRKKNKIPINMPSVMKILYKFLFIYESINCFHVGTVK